MNDQPVTSSADALYALGSSSDGLDAQSLTGPITAEPIPLPPKKNNWWRWPAIALAVSLLVAGGLVVLLHHHPTTPGLQAGTFNPVTVPLADIEKSGLPTQAAHTVAINGQLQVDGVVLLPSTQPNNPKLGQLYYDKTSNNLSYYNGQQFQALGGSITNNVTNIFNGTSAGPGNTTGAGVLLQGTTPGTGQIGNLNISGTAQVGELRTTVINSNGGTLYVNPVSATVQQQVVVGTPATAGLTAVGSTVESTGSGWHSDLSATKITTGNVGGTADSIAVYFNGGSTSDHVQVGLYEDNGNVPSQPGALLSASASVALNPNGFTTVPIPNVALSANTTYWLAVNTDSLNVGRAYNGGNKASCFVTSTYGFMPDPFAPFGCFFDSNAYSIYLNYTLGAGTSGSLSQAEFALGIDGQALFQNTTDTNTAFQVQNAAGSSTIFNVDTINGRVSIGKASAQYKLDVAGGDINLSSGHSVRFGGLQALNSNADGSIISVTNFLPSTGVVAVQADGGFAVKNANADRTYLNINSNGAAVFSNKTDTTAGFQVQNASAKNVFTVDTSDNQIILGNDGTAANVSVAGIRGGAVSGNNLSGKDLAITAGNGTGTGGSGSIVFQTGASIANPLVTLDTNVGAETGNTTTGLTWTHTTGNHNDRILIVTVTAATVSNPATAASVTYNGVALTQLAALHGTSNEANGSVWYLFNPPTGAHTVSVTYTGNVSGGSAESLTFYNIDSSNPIGGFTTHQVHAGSISTTLSGTNPGQGVFDAVLARGDWGTPIAGPGQTQLFLQPVNSRSTGSFKQQADAGSTTMSWSTNAGQSDLNHFVIAFNPEPNVTPDPIGEVLRVTQNGTLGIDLSSLENAKSTITLGGTADRTIGINQNPTTGAGHNLTIQAGGGAVGANNGGNLLLQGGIATGTGIAGSVIVRPPTDTTLAFQVQNAANSTTVLSVDTTNKIVTVTNLAVTGHIITSGTTPGIVAGAAACTTPTVSVSGNDTSGIITVTTGTGCAASGTLATLTFAAAFGAAPHVILTPGGPNALTLGAYIDDGTIGTASFAIGTNSTAVNATTYKWNYVVMQ